MYKSTFLLLALTIYTAAYSQQRPLYSFFDDNITAINPSLPRSEFIFEDYSLFVNATHRSQWIGFDNAPRTFLVQASTWLPDWSNWERLGNTHAGIDIIRDATAPFYNTGVYGRLGHLLFLNDDWGYHSSKTFIAAGLNFGVNWYRIKTQELGDIINAPELEGLLGTSIMPDVGFGVSFNHYITKAGSDFADSQGFYVGFSMPQMMGFTSNYDTDRGQLSVKRIRHYNFVTGGQFGVDAENLKVRPMVLVKYIPSAPLYISGSVELTLQEYLFIGFGANSNFGISARIGTNIPMDGPKKSNGDAIRIGIGYSRPMTSYSAGREFNTLEFTMTYMVNYQEY